MVRKTAAKSRAQKDPALASMSWRTSVAAGATQNERWNASSRESRPPRSAIFSSPNCGGWDYPPTPTARTILRPGDRPHPACHRLLRIYQRPVGSDVELCQVIVIIDQSSHVRVLRKVPFQKTNMDVPAMTQWSPIDLADVDGDGRVDVILQGDAYEDHWLEVVSVGQRSP